MIVERNTIVAVHFILSELLGIHIDKRRFLRKIGQAVATAPCHENELIFALILILRAVRNKTDITPKTIHYQYFVAMTLANSYLYDAQLSLSQWAQSYWIVMEPSKIFGAQLIFLNQIHWDLFVSEDDYAEVAHCVDLVSEVYV